MEAFFYLRMRILLRGINDTILMIVFLTSSIKLDEKPLMIESDLEH